MCSKLAYKFLLVRTSSVFHIRIAFNIIIIFGHNLFFFSRNAYNAVNSIWSDAVNCIWSARVFLKSGISSMLRLVIIICPMKYVACFKCYDLKQNSDELSLLYNIQFDIFVSICRWIFWFNTYCWRRFFRLSEYCIYRVAIINCIYLSKNSNDCKIYTGR